MISARERLHTMIRNRRLPHGLLLAGTPDSDALPAALSVAKHLLCTAEAEKKPCNQCPPCRNAAEGNHPDLIRVSPEKQELTIEQVRELQIWVARGPFEASSKIAIVEKADSMNAAASNALLKTLEEPPPYATILLVSASTERFLPTILSRLQIIRFPTPEDSSANDPSKEALWLPKLRELLKQPKGSVTDIFSITEQLGKDRASLPSFFKLFESHLRDRLSALHKEPSTLSEFDRTSRIFDETLKAESDLLRHYGNPALVLDALLVRWFFPDVARPNV